MTHVEHRPPVGTTGFEAGRTYEEPFGDGRRTHTLTNRSIPDLIKELRDETTLLMRQEVALAKTEMSEKAKAYGRDASYIGAGAFIAYAGFLFILGAITYALLAWFDAMDMSPFIAAWLAPGIVGVVVAGIGAAMIVSGKNKMKKESPAPRRTVESLQENKEWLKNKVSTARR